MINFVLVFIFVSHLLANDELDNFQKESLKDIPEPTIEYLYWNLIPDRWMWKEEYLVKGSYYKIPTISSGTVDSWTLDVYDNKELSLPAIFRLQNQFYLYKSLSDDTVCEIGINQKGSIPQNYLSCRSGYCYKENNNSKIEIFERKDLNLKSFNSKNKTCPYNVKVVTVDKGSPFIPPPRENSHYNIFKYKNIDTNRNFLEIEVNGKSAYLGIRHCSKLKSLDKCEPLYIKLSEHEIAWIELKKVQKEKSHKMLNLALEKVLPCVRTRNIACVKEFFMTKKKLESFDDLFVETEFTEDTFKELEACLKYESLLAHQKATKGISKVCIFENDTDGVIFQNVSYPEALSEKGDVFKILH